jgi:hypothetical protein
VSDLPTPRTTLAASDVRVRLSCRACRYRRDADLQALIDGGRGDVPLAELRWRCAWCGHQHVNAVVISKDKVRPG